MVAGLSPSDIISVGINLTPTGAALRNFGVLLIIGASNVIDIGSRIRQYADIDEVAADFSSVMPEYQAALRFFSQSPQPSILNIGRWASGPTNAVLNGAILNSTQQVTLLSSLASITNGSLRITVDNTVRNVTGLNFSSITNLNQVATVINGVLTGATVAWSPDSNTRFVVTSNSTGANSTLSYASAVGSGTDVSTMLGLSQAASASAPANGIIAESPLAAVQYMINYASGFGGSYGIYFADTTVTPSQHLAVAAFTEATSPSMMYGITTQDPATIDPTQTGDLASQMSTLKFKRTWLQYSSFDPYAAASFFGRAFTVDFTGSDTLLTMKFKTEPGVIAETLTETQAATLRNKHCNVFVNYRNGLAIIQEGVMSSGDWFDVIYGTDWLQNDVQTDVFNLFYTTTTKLPQTDAGMHLIEVVVAAALSDAVNNGLIAPGIWNADGFGELKRGNMLPTGYYIYAPAIGTQDETIRVTRAAPLIQCAVKLGGAIHSANVQINVNQ